MADVADGDGERQRGAVVLRTLCHDLRQPLVVVMGYVSMLQDGSFGELPMETTAILRTIEERLDAMSAIIDRVADSAVADSSGD